MPWSDYAPMVPSVFIPFGWVPLMVSIHRWASDERKIFAEIALAFAVMYGALLAMNYFVVLTVTLPQAKAGADSLVGRVRAAGGTTREARLP